MTCAAPIANSFSSTARRVTVDEIGRPFSSVVRTVTVATSPGR